MKVTAEKSTPDKAKIEKIDTELAKITDQIDALEKKKKSLLASRSKEQRVRILFLEAEIKNCVDEIIKYTGNTDVIDKLLGVCMYHGGKARTWNDLFSQTQVVTAASLQRITQIGDDGVRALLRYFKDNGIIIQDDLDDASMPFILKSAAGCLERIMTPRMAMIVTDYGRIFTMHELFKEYPTQNDFLAVKGTTVKMHDSLRMMASESCRQRDGSPIPGVAKYGIYGYEKDGDIYFPLAFYSASFQLDAVIVTANNMEKLVKKDILICPDTNEPFDWIEIWDMQDGAKVLWTGPDGQLGQKGA